MLCYDDKGNKNSPYCHVRYINADVKIGGIWDNDSCETENILNSDYFIVALGNDADNISVGENLRRMIGKKHLEEKDEKNVNQVVIAYAVFNTKLAGNLNNQRHYYCKSKDRADIYMYAFGGLDEVYSCDNIYMSKNKLLAESAGASYEKVKMKLYHIDDHKKRSNNEDKNYTHWSDLARAIDFLNSIAKRCFIPMHFPTVHTMPWHHWRLRV